MSSALSNKRYQLIDWLRGFSILLMIIYHFCYDLDFFGYIDTAFGKGFWIPFRYVIVIGFLTLVGTSLVLVHKNGIRWSSMKKRSIQLALACIAVTASGYFVAPNKITVFGILQFILVASWLVLPLLNYPRMAVMLGIVVFVAGHLYSHSAFDSIWLHWIGLVEYKRPALDYVPLLPWLGVVLLGIGFAHWLESSSKGKQVLAVDFLATRNRTVRLSNELLIKMGQHSLIIYLVHQPIMFAGFQLIEWIQ